jgi:hypothetical protein
MWVAANKTACNKLPIIEFLNQAVCQNHFAQQIPGMPRRSADLCHSLAGRNTFYTVSPMMQRIS